MQTTPAHDHEFLVEDVSDFDVEWDSDGGIIASVYCNFAPLIASATDYERDETYETYGERCDAQLTIYWDFKEMFRIDEEAEEEVPLDPDENLELYEDLMTQVKLDQDHEPSDGWSFVAMADTLDVGDEAVLVIEHEGTDYELVWEVFDVEVMG